MPHQANFDATCGANASAFGPNAACTSILLPLSSTASSRSVRTFHQQTSPAAHRPRLVIRVPHSNSRKIPTPLYAKINKKWGTLTRLLPI